MSAQTRLGPLLLRLMQVVMAPCLFALIGIFVFWLYIPGASGPLMLDDKSSLKPIFQHGSDLQQSLDLIQGDRSGPLGRPVSVGSFVLGELFFKEVDPSGKRFNIALHIVSGLLLAWLLFLLLSHHRIANSGLLAVVLAGVWLVAPLHVSTVLYSVQRMAILSAIFLFSGCIAYVCWRNRIVDGRRAWFFAALFFLFFILGIFSKENAVVLLPIVLLLEIYWFEGRCVNGFVHEKFLLKAKLSLASLVLMFSVILALLWNDIAFGYEGRDFDLLQRLLTQSRVLWDYVGQLALPNLDRMGLFHDDFEISRSIVSPITTLYSILGWFSLLLFLVFRSRYSLRSRLVLVGVLVFLTGHSVESTVLPLEVYFEHRNYFPSFGLLLVLSGLFFISFRFSTELIAPVVTCFVLVIILLGAKTSSLVAIWSSPNLLRIHHINAHPKSTRANEEMAIQLAAAGGLERALQYSENAYRFSSRERVGDRQMRDLALYCLSDSSVPESVFQELGSVNEVRPFSVVSIANSLVSILQDVDCETFDRNRLEARLTELFLGENAIATASSKFHAVFSGLSNSLGHFDNAYEFSAEYLLLEPESVQAMLMNLYFARILGKSEETDKLVRRLTDLEAAGRLSVSERRTLALYREWF